MVVQLQERRRVDRGPAFFESADADAELTQRGVDVTDEQWALIGPYLDAWKAKRVAVSVSGRHGDYDLREIVNAIFYQNRTGCQWAYLPHDLPPKSATYYYFALWRDDGTDQTIHDLLRCQARQKTGRREDPTAVVLDTQSIRAANHVPVATTGKDAAKKVPGRKRGLAVDTLGLIIAVVVTAASITDNAIGIRLLDKVTAHAPTVAPWVDAGFKQDLALHGAPSWVSTSRSSHDPTPDPGSYRPTNGGSWNTSMAP
nr:IS5 family transposase [Salinispora arenicola]